MTLLAAAGVALLVAGYGWGLVFPIIKKLWTSSYVLVAGGWSKFTQNTNGVARPMAVHEYRLA